MNGFGSSLIIDFPPRGGLYTYSASRENIVIRPTFMDDFETFDTERKLVATPEDVRAFQKKWFAEDDWPEWQKPNEWAQVSSYARRNRDQAEAATRRDWAPKMVSYALESGARYQYCKSLAMFSEIFFPRSIDEPRELGSNLWHLCCDYCLITTWSEGGLACPVCGRGMVYSWSGE
jgi:hypothetical protein